MHCADLEWPVLDVLDPVDVGTRCTSELEAVLAVQCCDREEVHHGDVSARKARGRPRFCWDRTSRCGLFGDLLACTSCIIIVNRCNCPSKLLPSAKPLLPVVCGRRVPRELRTVSASPWITPPSCQSSALQCPYTWPGKHLLSPPTSREALRHTPRHSIRHAQTLHLRLNAGLYSHEEAATLIRGQ